MSSPSTSPAGGAPVPTPWQRKVLWGSLTAVALVVLAAVAVLVLYLVTRGIAFLQPLLIPVVVAVILTYLLNPAVDFLTRLGLGRITAVLLLFLIIGTSFGGIVLWVGPRLSGQLVVFTEAMPAHAQRVQGMVLSSLDWAQSLQPPGVRPGEDPVELTRRQELWGAVATHLRDLLDWLQRSLPDIALSVWNFIRGSVGGFLGMAGFLLSLVLVPLFLFFFLKDSDRLAREWRNYIPLPPSPFRDEVASLVEEINGYLVRYFRGQFLVSLVDGVLIGTGLLLLGLNFSVLIGLMVGVMGMIPYLGLTLCWIPAVLLAAVQFGDWWHPLYVTLIFIGMNNLEGFFLSPLIVGDSVSLRPFTVIMSVLIWSLVLGGLLGALLAVPLTATLKVVLQRYVWGRHLAPAGRSP